MLRTVATWILVVLLGLLFVYTGASKLTGPSAIHWGERLSRWGYPAWFRFVIGAVEVAAGAALFLTRSRRAAAITLMIVMAGALLTHLVHGEFPRVLPPLILSALLYVVSMVRVRREPDPESLPEGA